MSMSVLTGEVGVGVPAALSLVVEALRAVDVEGLWRLSQDQVVEVLRGVGTARHLLEVLEVAVVREGLDRGLPGEASRTAHDWVAGVEGGAAPGPAVGHVSQVLRLARAGSGCAEVVGAFVGGDLALGKAHRLVRFEQEVGRVADQEMLSQDLVILLGAARDDTVLRGDRVCRRAGLSERELGAAITLTGRLLRPAKDLEAQDRRAKAGRSMHRTGGLVGLVSYRLVLDAEGAAVVDAAVAALAAPVPGSEGQRDERPAAARRADALVEIVRRGVSAPGEAPSCEKAQVQVTIPWQTLRDGVHGGGLTATGEVLPPSVVRRMACTGGVIPIVLGGEGEVLDVGRARRWFTPGQKRAIRLRDGGCTFPGCTIPAQWCDAHHVTWWSRGGGTGVSNGALLCERHHTRVHDRDLSATVTASGVTWHV